MIPNTDLFHKALRLAAWSHYAQVSKFGDPYITHPVAASYDLFAAYGAGECFDLDLAVTVAILHDVVEKSDVTVSAIEKDFGYDVAQGVAAMSKRPRLPKEKRLADSIDRILAQPQEIAMVKMADRISSMLPPPQEWDRQKITTILRGAEMIRQHLSHASAYLTKRLDGRIALYRATLKRRYG